ncbi:MAG: OB-fold nucleic acid binding domain-containing protein [Candidatus Aenigmatarchaeota archaeon]
MLSLDEIIKEIKEKTNFSEEEIKEMIEKKYDELVGLVSMEGAGHLVARDLGINLLTIERKPIKIETITEGLKGVRVKGRITQITPIREFKRKDGSSGKVCNIFISDGTGQIRVPLWDKQVEMIESGSLSEGDVITITDGVAKKNIYGGLEIRLPKYSLIKKEEDDSNIPSAPENISKRIEIKDAQEGFFEVVGNFVQLFNTSPIFHLCPTCRLTVEKREKNYICKEHGKVTPETVMIISGIIDDGTSNIRAVFFREQAQKFSGVDPSVLLNLTPDEALSMIKENTLGKEVILSGRIKNNKMFDRLEFVVNDIRDLDIKGECKNLLTQIEGCLDGKGKGY